MRKTVFAFLAIFIFFSSTLMLSSNAEARRHRVRRRHKTHLKVINEKKLYERLGGAGKLSTIVDDWVRTSLSDERMAGAFSTLTAKPEKLAHFRRGLNDGLCEIADGPCGEKSDSKKIPGNLAFNEDQFLVFSDSLSHSLQKYGVAEREKNELLGRLTELKADLTNDPTSGAVPTTATH